MTSNPTAATQAAAPVRIPANIDLEDRLVGRFTARQTAILGAAGALGYAVWTLAGDQVPLPVFLAACIPVAACAFVLAVGRRDGVTLDRWALGALSHYAQTRPARVLVEPDAPGWLTTNAHPAPAGRGGPRRPRHPVALPPRDVTPTGPGGGPAGGVGVIDLGPHGLAVCAVANPTGSFALRTPAEQESLTATFAGWLHSLSAPAQIVVRAVPLELSEAIEALHTAAPWLDHPALSAAALDHADYLSTLAEHHELLRRQAIIVLREPTRPTGEGDRHGVDRRGAPGGRAGEAELRLARRLAEAVELLAPAGIVVTPLDPARATAVLSAACHPGRLLPPTDPDQITTAQTNTAQTNTAAGRTDGGVW